MKYIELTGADNDPITIRIDQITGISPQNHAPPNGYSDPPKIKGTAVMMANQDYSFWAREKYEDIKLRIKRAVTTENPGFY